MGSSNPLDFRYLNDICSCFTQDISTISPTLTHYNHTPDRQKTLPHFPNSIQCKQESIPDLQKKSSIILIPTPFDIMIPIVQKET